MTNEDKSADKVDNTPANDVKPDLESLDQEFLDGIEEVIKDDPDFHENLEDDVIKPDDGRADDKSTRDDDPGDDDDGYGGGKDPVPDDALLTRAAKVDIDLSDAREMKPDLLEKMVARLEKVTAANDSEEGDASEGEESGKTDLDELIPDLDPDEYDPAVVDIMKNVKKVILGQQAVIDELRGQLGPQSESSIEKQIANYGKKYESILGKPGNINKAAVDKLERNIGYVNADAEADGETLSDEDVFNEAMERAFRSELKKIKGIEAKKKGSRRADRALNSPRTTDGQFAKSNSSGGYDYGTESERVDEAIDVVSKFFE